MAGTFETLTRGVEIHGTPRVRAAIVSTAGHRPALEVWENRLQGMISQSFGDTEVRAEALKRDPRGLGSSRVNVAVR